MVSLLLKRNEVKFIFIDYQLLDIVGGLFQILCKTTFFIGFKFRVTFQYILIFTFLLTQKSKS